MNRFDSDTSRRWEDRAILHVDLDAFFAAVEQLDHPEWRGRPVIVGGDPDRRGVVSTCSYEARAFGVRSAMPSAQARALCPDAIWTHGSFGRYREISREVMGILADESPHLRQISIDEAFIDITPDRANPEHPIHVAERIRKRISELGITASAGLSNSQTTSKIGSDFNKPDGITVIWPGEERAFLAPLPASTLSGIGPKTMERLRAFGVQTLGDLSLLDDDTALAVLGSNADVVRERAAGIDLRPVADDDDVKSISNERSFAADLTDRDEIVEAIRMISAHVGRRLRRSDLTGRTITLKLRGGDLRITTAQRTLDAATDLDQEIESTALELFTGAWRPGDRLRLVGVGVSGFCDRQEQGSLFDEETAEPEIVETSRRSRGDLARGLDAIKERFGDASVGFGRELRFGDKYTGTPSMKDES